MPHYGGFAGWPGSLVGQAHRRRCLERLSRAPVVVSAGQDYSDSPDHPAQVHGRVGSWPSRLRGRVGSGQEAEPRNYAHISECIHPLMERQVRSYRGKCRRGRSGGRVASSPRRPRSAVLRAARPRSSQRSAQRGRPVGRSEWQKEIAIRLGLEPAYRPWRFGTDLGTATSRRVGYCHGSRHVCA
jgi:hypothetical protein